MAGDNKSNLHLPPLARARLWVWRLVRSAWDYEKKFRINKRLAPVWFVRRVWGMEWGVRAVFLALLTSAVATGLLLDRARGEVSPDRSALDAMLLVFFGLAWSTAAATAVTLRRWACLVVFAWLAHTGLLSMSAMARTPVMVMPVLWLLVLAWRGCAAEAVRWRFVLLWTGISLMGGYVTSGPSGFREWLGISPWTGRLILAAVYAALGLLARVRLPERWRRAPTWTWTLAGSAAVIGLLVCIVWRRDAALTVSWMPDLMMFIEPVVSLFWLWTGAGFIFGTWKLIDFGTRRVARLNLMRVAVWLVPVAWGLGLFLEWFVLHGNEYLLSIPGWLFMRTRGLIVWLLRPSVPVAWACEWHVWITLGIILMGLFARDRGSGRLRLLIRLTGVWIASFAGLVSFVAFRQRIHDIAMGADELIGPLALTAMAATLVFELSRIQKDWGACPPAIVRRQLGWMMVAGAIVCTAHIVRGDRARVEEGLMLYHGMLFFGATRAIYSRLSRVTAKAKRLTDFHQAMMALVGIFTGWVLMAVSATDWRWLLLGLPQWALILLLVRRWQPAWDAVSGAMAGAMLGAGALFYWIIPFPLNFPFIGHWFMLDALRHPPRKSYPDEFLFQLIGACTLLGALTGYLIFKSRGTPLKRSEVAMRTGAR